MTQNDIEDLETVDKILLKRIFEVPSSTPSAALYLELGCAPIRFYIQAKRLKFLQYILKLDKEDLVSKVFFSQVENPGKNDWWLTVKTDLEKFNLSHLTFDQIESTSKNKFKKIVNTAFKVADLQFLIEEKESKCKSKMSKLEYITLELQPYLKSAILLVPDHSVVPVQYWIQYYNITLEYNMYLI